MAVLTITGPQGHTNLEYDPDVPGDLLEAEREFNSAVERGHVGYADGMPTVKFDPAAKHIMTAPVVVPG